MNPIDDVVNYILKTADRTLDENIVRNAVHNLFAVLINRRRKTLHVGKNNMLVNYFGIVLAGSNSGKGHINKKLSTLFDSEAFEKDVLSPQFMQCVESTAAHDGTAADSLQLLTRYNQMSIAINDESTTQGIHKIAEFFSILNSGSMNFVNNEFFSTANMSIMTQLLEGYDGNFAKPNIKGSDTNVYFDVKNVPVNLIGYSSIKPLLNNNNSFRDFAALMETGWFRRTWMTTDNSHKKVAKIEEEYILNDKTKFFLNMDMQDFIDFDFSNIYLSDDAKKKFEELRIDVINSEDKYIFGDYRDAYKILKLAAIRAASELRDNISVLDLEYALSFEKHCHNEAAEMLSLKDDFVHAYSILKNYHTSKTDMISRGIINSKISDKAFEEFLFRVAEYSASKHGQLISETRNGFKFYRVILPEKVSPSLVGISTSTQMGEGYVYEEVNFERIANLLKADGINYSAGKFKDGIRRKENYYHRQSLIILDVDDGMTLQQAKHLFSNYKCVIGTTRNHQKEKNGIICDRFRIILVPNQVMKFDPDTYYEFMINVYSYLGQSFDRACADASRMYFSSKDSDVWISEGEELFDITPCIPHTKEEEATAKVVEKFEDSIGAMSFFALEASKGNRNKMLFRFAIMRKDDGVDYEKIRDENLSLKSRLTEPLS